VPPAPAEVGDTHRNRRIAGIILILIGLLFYAQYFLPAFGWATLWPAILIVVGVYILLRGRRS
jgi:high-affinity Fe2+/Pb2+ permease